MDVHGVWVPLVTPFHEGRVDTTSLKRLCTHLLDQGVDGLVPCGTTGEAPTLSKEERVEVIGCVAEVAGEHLIAGAGAISTEETVGLVADAARAGASAALVISPFFVNPSDEEIAQHYRTVADTSSIPLIVYNFPARTGAGVPAALTLDLAPHPNIVGTKQSVASLDSQLQDVILGAPPDFAVMVGGAGLLWPALALGAAGGILAAAHLKASLLLRITREARRGDLDAAATAHRELWPRLAGTEAPAPIKRRLFETGLIDSPEMRAPLRSS
jgi:4-hydroxy-tetrahydrodipicolinate synthase